MKFSIVSVAICLISGKIAVASSDVAHTPENESGRPNPLKRSTRGDDILQMLWYRLSSSNSSSLLKKYLTEDVFIKLKDRVTRYNGTLADCIRSGCMNPQSECGIYASDPYAYDIFSRLFYPIIRDYNRIEEVEQPNTDLRVLSADEFDDLDPDDNSIVSVRISVRRSLANYGFPPTTTNEARIAMERKTTEALNTLDGELAGTYFNLTSMGQDSYQTTANDFQLENDNPEKHDAYVYRDWPIGRGVFLSHDRKFLVLLNEEDHLHFVSMQKGGNLDAAWNSVAKALNSLEKILTFARHQRLGFLTFSPTNLGTALRVSLQIRIPNLSKNMTRFKQLCDTYSLHQQRSGESVFDISNKRILGLTERQILNGIQTGVKVIFVAENEG